MQRAASDPEQDRQPTTPPRKRVARTAGRRAAAVVLIAVAGTAGIGAAAPDYPARLFDQVVDLVEKQFVDADSRAVLYEKAARGLIRELGDPYSELLTPRDLREFERSTLGRYAGVGMEILPAGDSIYVGRVFEGSASEARGLRRGDRLVAVDGGSIAGFSPDSVVARLRGLPGTPVVVTVERLTVPAPITVTLSRATVHVPAVPYVLVEGGVGYIPIVGFPSTAASDVARALEEVAGRGARGVVLDLRGNPGGALDQAVDMVGTLVPRGTPAVEIRERARTQQVRTRTQPVAPVLPTVVLVDDRSASAAEIVAGALQDHDRAVLVGERTFGKGLAQAVYSVDGGYALKLTVARWYTPSGRSIHRDRTAGDSTRRLSAPTAGEHDSLARFRSAGGRVLLGGGGITPDVVLAPDTLQGAERALARALAREGARVTPALARIAVRLGREVASAPEATFRLPADARAQLRAELSRAGVTVSDTVWNSGAPYLTRLLEQRVADFAYGQAAARRRALAFDRPYQVADSLLHLPSSVPSPEPARLGAVRGLTG